MPEIFHTFTAWLTTSRIKILGILIVLIILSQISKWIINLLRRHPDDLRRTGNIVRAFIGQGRHWTVAIGFDICLQMVCLVSVEI